MSVPVIVTGNLGYLGPIVVKKLRDQGAVVLGIDPNFFEADLPYDCTPDVQVTSLDKAPRAFWEPKAVVHLAAISNDPMGDLNPTLTYNTNVTLVSEVAEAFGVWIHRTGGIRDRSARPANSIRRFQSQSRAGAAHACAKRYNLAVRHTVGVIPKLQD